MTTPPSKSQLRRLRHQYPSQRARLIAEGTQVLLPDGRRGSITHLSGAAPICVLIPTEQQAVSQPIPVDPNQTLHILRPSDPSHPRQLYALGRYAPYLRSRLDLPDGIIERFVLIGCRNVSDVKREFEIWHRSSPTDKLHAVCMPERYTGPIRVTFSDPATRQIASALRKWEIQTFPPSLLYISADTLWDLDQARLFTIADVQQAVAAGTLQLEPYNALDLELALDRYEALGITGEMVGK
jgi:hypothetical protein